MLLSVVVLHVKSVQNYISLNIFKGFVRFIPYSVVAIDSKERVLV